MGVGNMSDKRTGAEAGLLAEITLSRLRHHFKEKYLLNESQVELMVFSSAQSVREGLGRLADLGEGSGRQELIGAYHGLKGLFLNMGEDLCLRPVGIRMADSAPASKKSSSTTDCCKCRVLGWR